MLFPCVDTHMFHMLFSSSSILGWTLVLKPHFSFSYYHGAVVASILCIWLYIIIQRLIFFFDFLWQNHLKSEGFIALRSIGGYSVKRECRNTHTKYTKPWLKWQLSYYNFDLKITRWRTGRPSWVALHLRRVLVRNCNTLIFRKF
jgi:hypothetical protein